MSHLPPETFRIYDAPESSRYFVVHVGESVQAMRRTMRRCGFDVPRGLVGACSAATNASLPGLTGVVWLSRPLGAGLVTHELAHAAFRALDRRKVRVNHWTNRKSYRANQRSTEEHYALTLEHLTREFWQQAYAVGLVRVEAQDVA